MRNAPSLLLVGLFVIVVGLAPASGCDDDGASGADATDATGTDTAPADAAGDITTAACHEHVNIGTVIAEVLVAEAPPVAKGGTILEGTYLRTGYQRFTGVGGSTAASTNTLKEKLSITVVGGSIGTRGVVSENGGPDMRFDTVVVRVTNFLQVTTTCPDGVPSINQSFNFEGRELTLIDNPSSSGDVVVHTFSLQ